jgi:hypothetical protein
MKRVLGTFLLFLLISAALLPYDLYAQEVYAFGGRSRDIDKSSVRSNVWGFSYAELLGKNYLASFTWLNEGHLGKDHRDGFMLQAWVRTYLFSRLSLSAGAGPYVYCNTVRRQESQTVTSHGVAASVSLAAAWHLQNRWLLQLRTNWIDRRSLSATFGFGYLLEPSDPPFLKKKDRPADHELTLSAGQSIDSSYNSRHSFAQAVEYRRRVAGNLEWTVGWLNEGDDAFFGRHGPYTQLSAVRDFYDGRLTFGLAFGPYFSWERRDRADTFATVSAMLSMTGTYRFTPAWGVRVAWNRIMTHYHRDADVVLGGISYRF